MTTKNQLTKTKAAKTQPTGWDKEVLTRIAGKTWTVFSHQWDSQRMVTSLEATMPDPLSALALCRLWQTMWQAGESHGRPMTVWFSTDVVQAVREVSIRWPNKVFDQRRFGWTDLDHAERIHCKSLKYLIDSMLERNLLDDVGQNAQTSPPRSSAK